MRSKIVALIAPVTLTLSLLTLANADTVPASIQARYATGIAATEKSDFEPFAGCFAPNFVLIQASGKPMSRTAWLSDVRKNMKETTKATVKVIYGTVRNHDGIVDVSFDNTMKFTTAAGLVTVHEVGVDSWKKIGGTWLVIKTVDKVMDVVAPKPPNGK